MEAARRVGVIPASIPSAQFYALAAGGDRMIYVLVSGQLLASRRQVLREHITHAFLAGGVPVQAAGEFEVVAEQGAIAVSYLDNSSGHYLPDAASLEIARRAFEHAGLRVREGAVSPVTILGHHDSR